MPTRCMIVGADRDFDMKNALLAGLWWGNLLGFALINLYVWGDSGVTWAGALMVTAISLFAVCFVAHALGNERL